MKRNSRDLNKLDQSGSQLDGGASTQMLGSKIARLQETEMFYDKKIKNQGDKLEELEDEIKKKEQELESKRKKLRENRQSNRKRQGVELHVTDTCDPVILANKITLIKQKINNQKTKLNEAISKNKYFKDQVNVLREEKYICDNIYHKLEVELAVAKNQLREGIQEKEKLKFDKKESLMQLESTKRQRVHQKKEFEKQFQSVFKILENVNRDKRQEEMGLKKTFSEMTNTQRSPNKDDASPGKRKGLHDKKKDDEPDLKEIKRQVEEKKKQVEEYQEIYETLLVETKSNDIDEIVKKFNEYQDENYQLFNYINTLRDEYESLNKEKKELQKQVSQFDQQIKNPIEEKDPKTKKFKELTREITLVRRKREKFEEEYKKLKQIINQLKISVPIMFDRIGCNSEEYTRELGGGILNAKDIDESNMLQILGVIEKRTNDLLQLYSVAYKHGDQKNQKGNDDSNQSFSNFGGKYDNKKIEDFLPEGVKKAWVNNYEEAEERIKKIKEESQDKQGKKELYLPDTDKKPQTETMLSQNDFVKYVEEKVIKKTNKEIQQGTKNQQARNK